MFQNKNRKFNIKNTPATISLMHFFIVKKSKRNCTDKISTYKKITEKIFGTCTNKTKQH
jgi:hypothetical protein